MQRCSGNWNACEMSQKVGLGSMGQSVNGIDRNSTADEIPGELMNNSEIQADEHREQWEKYRRLWIYWVAIFAGFVPAVMGLTIASSKIFHTDALFPYIGCQLNRSTQHFLEAYSQEFEILKFFLDAGLIAAPLCPDPLAYSRTGQFS